MVRIVVLDGYTLNSGDLSWDDLAKLGTCDIHDRTAPAETLSRLSEAEIALTNKVMISAEAIESLRHLKYIGVLATGFNIVDVDAARRRGIPVTNVPTYGTESVAQMVFAHLLHLTQHVAEHSASVREGNWSRSEDFCYSLFPLSELSEKSMGIVGLGRIGQATARLARAFGMRVLYHDTVEVRTPPGAVAVDLDQLFRESDVISLHCPLTEASAGLVNEARLAAMKETAFLINTSRGPLVDEVALAAALNSGSIEGAGLDVLSVEPPPSDHPLFSARNCHITPHIAWATKEARRRLMAVAVANVRSFLEGRPRNVVNA